MWFNLLICFIPENQEGIGISWCGKREKDVVPFEVCKGSVGITVILLCMLGFTVRDTMRSSMHFAHSVLPVTDS